MVIAWYQSALSRRPLLTQSLTTSLLFATGDVISQQGVENRGVEGHDLARTARMAGYGGLVFGPAASQWYKLLDKIHISSAPKMNVPVRVLADQGIFTPLHLTAFFSSMAWLSGESTPTEKLRTAFWPTYQTNIMVWPGIQLVNFAFVPLQHRILVVNVAALGWNTYLSYANQKQR